MADIKSIVKLQEHQQILTIPEENTLAECITWLAVLKHRLKQMFIHELAEEICFNQYACTVTIKTIGALNVFFLLTKISKHVLFCLYLHNRQALDIVAWLIILRIIHFILNKCWNYEKQCKSKSKIFISIKHGSADILQY